MADKCGCNAKTIFVGNGKVYRETTESDGLNFCKLHKAAASLLDALQSATWLVWSNEHCAWWGPNRSNYYTSIESAGRYSLEEAMRICRFRSQTPNENPTELIQPSPEWIEARSAAIASASP